MSYLSSTRIAFHSAFFLTSSRLGPTGSWKLKEPPRDSTFDRSTIDVVGRRNVASLQASSFKLQRFNLRHLQNENVQTFKTATLDENARSSDIDSEIPSDSDQRYPISVRGLITLTVRTGGRGVIVHGPACEVGRFPSPPAPGRWNASIAPKRVMYTLRRRRVASRRGIHSNRVRINKIRLRRKF